jgi:trimeric autotransporter adhesin
MIGTVAIQTEALPLPATSNGTAVSSTKGGAFEDYLQTALQTGNATEPTSSAPHSKSARSSLTSREASPATLLAQVQQPVNAKGPSFSPAPSSDAENAAAASAAAQAGGQALGGTRLSWLAQMLPDESISQGSEAAASLLQRSSQPDLAQGKATGASAAQQPGHSSDTSSPSGTTGAAAQQGGNSSKTSSASSTTGAAAQQDGNSSKTSSDASTAGAAGAKSGIASKSSLPAGSGNDTAREGSSTQIGLDMNEAMASLGRSGLPVISGSSLESSNAMSGASQKPEASAVKTSSRTPSSMDAPARTAPSKSGNAADSRPASKDGSSSNGDGTPDSNGNGDSPGAAKETTASSGDNSKNAMSQDSSGKSSGSAQTSNSANAAGANTQVGSAAQASLTSLTGFPAALSQAASTGDPAGQAGAAAPSANSAQAPTGNSITAAMDTPVNAPGATVGAASLMQSDGRAEMRVAVQTDTMGTLQLHAVLESGQIGASIAVVSHEAHTLLNNELPALQQVLADQNVRLDHLTVVNTPMSAGGGAENGWNFKSGDFNQPRNQAQSFESSSPATATTSSSAEPVAEIVPGRLSVRA